VIVSELAGLTDVAEVEQGLEVTVRTAKTEKNFRHRACSAFDWSDIGRCYPTRPSEPALPYLPMI
jgi:hypothetical protein